MQDSDIIHVEDRVDPVEDLTIINQVWHTPRSHVYRTTCIAESESRERNFAAWIRNDPQP
jgi:hypothetical protein